MTAMCGSAAADQNTSESMLATLKEINVEVNGSGTTTQMFAYELNSLQYFRAQDICQAVDFYVSCDAVAKTIRINTFKSYADACTIPNPEKKSVYVNPEKAQIYFDGLLYNSYSSFTVDGVLYIPINDIVNASSNAADLVYKPESMQPPRIIWLDSDNPSSAVFISPSAADTRRYLMFDFDKAANVLKLTVAYKLRTSVNVEPQPPGSDGKQFLPVYPLQSEPKPLSPGN